VITGTELWQSVQVGQSLGSLEADLVWEDQEVQLEGLGNHHPWFREVSPYGGKLMDPFVMIRFAPKLIRQALPHVSRAVYSKYAVELLRPVYADSKITVTGRIADKYEKRGGLYINYQVEYVAEDREPVMRVNFHTLINADEVLARKGGN
jgi:acyl dehydratase